MLTVVMAAHCTRVKVYRPVQLKKVNFLCVTYTLITAT